MKKYLELIRVKHWIKNILIFIPLVSAKAITCHSVIITSLGFLSFSFVSSFIYIINDIRDIEKDKLHSKKKKRPLASGKIKKNIAIIIGICLLLIAIIINSYINKSVLNNSLCLLFAYVILNIGYSMGLKNIAIVDIALLTTGFVLRVYYGAAIDDIVVSNWLFLTILNASLFLGLGKRKKELIHNKNSRKVLEAYNEAFLDKFGYVSLSLTLIFYSLWTLEQNTKFIVFTIPFLIVIFMRYSLIIEKTDEGDPVTVLYHDNALIALCFAYALLMVLLLVIL